MMEMVSAVTQGIRISVDSFYQGRFSNPVNGEYVFAYRIRIENNADQTIQLLRRHWYIFDSNGIRREVEGEGVLGQQPVIRPENYHEYASGCHLRTAIGKMHGTYLMQRQQDGDIFKVRIPEFQLIAPLKLN